MTGAGRRDEMRLLLGSLKPCFDEMRQEFDKQLFELTQRDGLEAEDLLDLMGVLDQVPDSTKLKQQLTASAVAIPNLVRLLEHANPSVVERAAFFLMRLASTPGALTAMLTAHIVSRALELFLRPTRDGVQD